MVRPLVTFLVAIVTAAGAGCGGEEDLEASAPRGSQVAGTWERVPAGPLSPRESATAVWTGDEVLVLGGSDAPPCPPTADCVTPDVPPLADGAAYDPVTERWRSVAESPVPFGWAEAAVLDGLVYLWIDGLRDRPGARRAFLAYDPRADRWKELPLPPRDREWRQIVAAGDRIVAYRGSDEQGERPDLAFDPATGAWSELPADPLSPSFDRAMAWTGEELVLFEHELVPNPGAAEPSLTRAAALDLRAGSWRRLPDSEILGTGPWALHEGRLVNPTLGAADGGETNGWGRSHAYGGVLDPQTGEWSPLPDPPQGDQAFAAGVLTSDGARFFGHRGWVLDARTGEWLGLPARGEAEDLSQGQAVAAAGDDALFVFGGAHWEDGDGKAELLADAAIWRR